MFNITLVGDRALVLRMQALPAEEQKSLRATVQSLTLRLQAHVVRDKLSGQVLKVRTGALRRSIQQKVTASSSAVYGEVYSSGDVKYAGIHEFGGTTPPHDIVPTRAQALSFMIGGRQVFAKIVHHPGSVMPERSFLRSSLADYRPTIESELNAALIGQIRSAVHGGAASEGT